jgi:hypothetical protein
MPWRCSRSDRSNRRPLREEDDLRELLPALDLRVRVGERRLEVVCHVLVELVVLLFGDLRLRARQQRGRLVHLLVRVGYHHGLGGGIPLLLLHQDGHRDVVGVLAEDAAQTRTSQQVVLLGTQVQDDLGSARLLRDDLDRVVALAGALPADRLLSHHACPPGDERDAVGDDERGVEADAELWSITSCRDIPMPLSAIVMVRAVLS